jgi:hypothetical protein
VEPLDPKATKGMLDELFTLAGRYRSGQEYGALLGFVTKFRTYAPFNAMLVHVQMPGAQYVATPSRWLRDYGRRVKPTARPLTILQPMGPVMFVFDVSDTDSENGAPPLPVDVERPFEVRGGRIGRELEQTIENAKRDGVEVMTRKAGSQSAGEIRHSAPGRYLEVAVRTIPKRESVTVKRRYDLLLNEDHSREARYATLAHELGHLYCGHLGTPDDHWWPDRRGLGRVLREFEAESVCYIVSGRMGIDNPSDQYLSEYLKPDCAEGIPSISLDCVMKAAGLIEQMGKGRLRPRKEKGA